MQVKEKNFSLLQTKAASGSCSVKKVFLVADRAARLTHSYID